MGSTFEPAHAEEDWLAEFERLCGMTDVAGTLGEAELSTLITDCDRLIELLQGIDDPKKKMYIFRIKKCKNLFEFVLAGLRQPREVAPIAAGEPPSPASDASVLPSPTATEPAPAPSATGAAAVEAAQPTIHVAVPESTAPVSSTIPPAVAGESPEAGTISGEIISPVTHSPPALPPAHVEAVTPIPMADPSGDALPGSPEAPEDHHISPSPDR